MGVLGPYLELTKPRVVVLLQITALCAVLVHDMLDSGLSTTSGETMLIVFVGGYLSAGGANAVNMWYDRDIDPKMSRTAARPVPSGAVPANAALGFGIALSMLGVAWFVLLANQVAAFWSAFSILFYVFVYSIWLKRRTPQNIVIGGIAGSTPPVIGWAIPNPSAALAGTAPDGTGLAAVRDILGSMSRSYHMLTAFAPPALRYPPTKTISIVSPEVVLRPESSMSCTSTAQSAVIWSSTTTLGLVNSRYGPRTPITIPSH
jgi:hypothetical protein